MSIEPHPQMTEVLDGLQRFSSSLEEQMNRTSSESFTATDEAETVEVTINGDRCLTGLHIEEGLLRQGAETVQQRINEALHKAQADADGAFEIQQEQVMSSLSDIARVIRGVLGD